MTVQDLIDELMSITNKDALVLVENRGDLDEVDEVLLKDIIHEDLLDRQGCYYVPSDNEEELKIQEAVIITLNL